MALGVDRYGSRADTGAFIACLLLSLTALALPEALRAPIAAALRRTVLAPALAVQQRSAVSTENRANLDALRAQRDSLALGAALVPELSAENARLRGLLGLGERLGTGFVTAEVLHQAGIGDGMTLVLSAGRNDGVEPLAPVVAPDGLVGMVRTVDAHTSIALAWTHPDFRASAMIESRHVYGIVVARRGERAGDLMELQGIAFREALAPGTPVVTSGLGGALRGWIDGRATVVVNGDTWTDAPLDALLDGWDGERCRLLVAGRAATVDRSRPRLAGAVLPWSAVAGLEAEPSGLWEALWGAEEEAGRLDWVAAPAAFADCGTPGSYLAANLAATGGRSAVGLGAEVAGVVDASVVWPGCTVAPGERLRRAIRYAEGRTVLVR